MCGHVRAAAELIGGGLAEQKRSDCRKAQVKAGGRRGASQLPETARRRTDLSTGRGAARPESRSAMTPSAAPLLQQGSPAHTATHLRTGTVHRQTRSTWATPTNALTR